MDEEPEATGPQPFDRRKFLRRAAAGGALVWAAPSIVTVGSAVAQEGTGGPPPPDRTCGGLCCPGQDNSCDPNGCFCDCACQGIGDCCPDFAPTCCNGFEAASVAGGRRGGR